MGLKGLWKGYGFFTMLGARCACVPSLWFLFVMMKFGVHSGGVTYREGGYASTRQEASEV